MKMLKHVGRLTTTDQRVVVIYMQIPGAENYALVCSSDSLPDRLHQNVMELVESDEGQNSKDLADILGRRMLQDTRKSVLQTLHEQQRLTRVPVDYVVMTPHPGASYNLRTLLKQMGRSVPASDATDTAAGNEKFNPFAANRIAEETADTKAEANGLLRHARMLIAEANAKITRAYEIAPSLRPEGAGETVTPEIAEQPDVNAVAEELPTLPDMPEFEEPIAPEPLPFEGEVDPEAAQFVFPFGDDSKGV